MKSLALAASPVFLLLALGCGSSDTHTNQGTGGGGEDTGGGGGGPATGGAPGQTGGAPGATGGAAGGGTASPDASVGTGGETGAPDAGSTGGSGGQGGGGQGGTGGAPDGGATGDTWDSFAKGFFVTYCASCHNDDKKGDATRDYHVMANVLKEKAEIACGVSKAQADWSKRGCSGFPPARQFPVGSGPKPTDAERDRLLRWIDSGTP